MLSPVRLEPLPPPHFDVAAVAEYARRGYAWTPLSYGGMSARWLTAPGWTRAGQLPGTGADGFVPLAGFLDPATQAAVGVRYGSAGLDFDLADFLDVADPRPACRGVEYRLDGTLVAERAGGTPSTLFAIAAHRRGRHLLVVASECPAAAARELTAAMTAFAAGLVIDGPPHAPLETYRRASPAAVPVTFDYPARFELEEAGTAVALRATYAEGPPAELSVAAVAPGPSAERALAARAVELHQRVGRPEPSSVRVTQLELSGGAAAVRTCELADGREATLAVVPLAGAAAIALEALYAGRRRSPRAWMAARFTTRRLLASCRSR